MTSQSFGPGPQEFAITGEQGGELHASNGHVGLSVFSDGDTRMVKRNAIKDACTASARKVQWLVAELNGVKVYVADDGSTVNIVLTEQDLYP